MKLLTDNNSKAVNNKALVTWSNIKDAEPEIHNLFYLA